MGDAAAAVADDDDEMVMMRKDNDNNHNNSNNNNNNIKNECSNNPYSPYRISLWLHNLPVDMFGLLHATL